jgi:hypothetical protein
MLAKYSVPICLLVSSTFASLAVQADSVVSQNQIVQGSLCVGTPCVDGELFEFDTIRLKSESPMLMFQDTSSPGGFPSNDWSIGATDGGSGRVPTLYIRDVTASLDVLRVEPGLGGGVALGAGSTLEAGDISVGSPGNERKVRHVADGVADTDAVTLGQFTAWQAQVEQNLPAQAADLDKDLTALAERLETLAQQLQSLTQTDGDQ